MSRQTLHNYREIKTHFGVPGLIDGYRMVDGTDEKQQRARHPTQCPPGNKAQQMAAPRAEDWTSGAAAQAALNFSFGEEGRAQEVEARDHPFATEHGWEASRYAGCFVYWPTLIARWRWLELVMGHFGAGWRIFAVFLPMPGRTNQVTCDSSGRIVDFETREGKGEMKHWIFDVVDQWQSELSAPPVSVFDREGYDAGFFFRLVTGFKLIDSERQDIANPDIKPLEKRIARLRKALDKRYKQLTKTPPRTNKDGTVRGNSRHLRLQETIAREERELKALREEKGRLLERRAAQEQFCRKLTALGAQTPLGKRLVVEVGESPL